MDAPPAVALGSRDPVSVGEWLERFAGQVWVGLLQAPTRARLGALAGCLARHAGWQSYESWPGWEALCAASGWSRRRLAEWLAQLRLDGWLVRLEAGSTPATRPMGLKDVYPGNRRAVYGLRIPLKPSEAAAPASITTGPEDPARVYPEPSPPLAETLSAEEAYQPPPAPHRAEGSQVGPPRTAPATGPRRAAVDEFRTPTWLLRSSSSRSPHGSSRASQLIHNPAFPWTVSPGHNDKPMPLRGSTEEETTLAFASTVGRVPRTTAEMLAAAGELREKHPVLARCSPRRVRALCRPFFAAGWTGADVLHALAYRPSATSTLPAMPAERVHHPAGWARARLSAWRDEAGRVLPARDERDRVLAAVRAEHGQAAAAALPAGQRMLLPAHVSAHAQSHAGQAHVTLERNRRRDRADRLARIRPPAEAAAAPTRAAALTAIRDHLTRRRRARQEPAERPEGAAAVGRRHP